MIARENRKLLENILLPNGPGAVIVSLSTHVCTALTRLHVTRTNARTAVYQGKGFPRFPTVAARRRMVLILSGKPSIVKIRPR
jgi:hypothetical protein